MRLSRIVRALFLSAAFVFAGGVADSYREGIAAFEAGQLDRAVTLLHSAAETAKNNAQYWKAYGVALAKRGDVADAVDALAHACRLDRRLPDACYYLGRGLYAKDQYEQALDPLRKSLDSDSQKGRAETALAQALEALGRNEEAEKRFRSALSHNDDFVQQTRIAYGRFLLRAGRVDESLAMLERAQNPELPEALLEYSRALMQANRTEKAAPLLERLVQLSPRDPAARLLLGKAYRRLGRNAEAVREEQATQLLQP